MVGGLGHFVMCLPWKIYIDDAVEPAYLKCWEGYPATVKDGGHSERKFAMSKTADALQAYLASLDSYLKQAEAYVDGHRNALPDPELICSSGPFLDGGSILSATPNEDQFGPRLDARIKHPGHDEIGDQRSPRHFDPFYFAPFPLLELSGVPLIWHEAMQKEWLYFRLMCETPSGHPAQGGITVARVVCDTPAGLETFRPKGTERWAKLTHYDFRRAAFAFSTRRRPHPPRFGRADVLALILNEEHRAIVQRAFDLADRIFAKLYAQEEAAE
jgi:hypothetical protein